MTSVRERLLRAVLARLSAAVAPVPVLRAPTSPVRRDDSPALLLFPETDAVTGHANALVDRALTFRLVAIARGIPDLDSAFDVADRLVVAAHAALFADPNLGGLAIALREIDSEWDAEDADAGAVAMPVRYEIRYRTHAQDLTRPG
ncbi:hypothetical protein [Caldimonas brevitalea]|uniref:DUF3168 domain-containing protein n=1 Tax=Caldimonas brevitalea TaxID=413882 RepID=A0A0G3BVX3_9BURK|nr:hypothetical protein [Caldimonas brevitalea]AKJ30680.1 hypothetical protein AAW51_3989 [Caldimonas brevitalea]